MSRLRTTEESRECMQKKYIETKEKNSAGREKTPTVFYYEAQSDPRPKKVTKAGPPRAA
jgi:hypothetical protein